MRPSTPGQRAVRLPSSHSAHGRSTPSLPTLEKAVSARIYFENLYFPVLAPAALARAAPAGDGARDGAARDERGPARGGAGTLEKERD
jgi:hypothetical protein